VGGTGRIAILAAMPNEVSHLAQELEPDGRATSAGKRQFHTGELFGVPVVLGWSRWGKVAAASAAVHVIAAHRPAAVVFTGVAGALAPDLRVGDVVVADRLVQHDMDASPLYPRHEIPLLGLSELPADPALCEALADAAEGFLREELPAMEASVREGFSLDGARARTGLVLSGDRFISGPAATAELLARLPDALAVEMEGAAVAQVCVEHEVPFAVLRTISDVADDNAHVDFAAFLQDVAGIYCHGILRRFLAAGP
jgi:adenosylhomocysteine nucleosidase